MVWHLILKSVFFSFILVFGLIGNVFVIFFFSFKMKKAPNFRWLVVHLAIADVIYAIVTPTQFLYLLYTNNEWRLGIAMCKVIPYVGPLTVNVSAWILCFMGYERYRAICQPFSRRLSLTIINLTVFIIWIICIVLKIDIFLRLNIVNNNCIVEYKKKTPYLVNSVASFLTDSLIPIVLLSYFLVRVNIALRIRARYLDDMKSNNNRYKFESTSRILLAKHLASNSQKTGQVEHSRFSINVQMDRNFNNRFRLSRASLACKSTPNEILRWDTQSLTSNKRFGSDDEILKPLSSKVYMQGSKHSVSALISAITRKRTSFHELAKVRIKNAGDRAIVNVFLFTVIIFFLSSLPYNAFYFIVVLLYTSHFSEAEINKHNSGFESANSWLGLLVLSGSVMNVFIYSGKFPEFRQKMYAWLNQNLRMRH